MAGVKRTLSVDLQGLVLPTPVMIAAGCSGTGRELSGLVDLRKVGAVVSRSITLEADRGSATPRIAETAAGVVWSTGLQNPGIDAFVEQELPRLARTGSHVVVSIAGTTLEEYVRLTGSLQGRPEVSALEVYLSGPDGELGREILGAHVDRAAEIAGAVARMSLVPVFAKLPMNAPDLGEIAARRGARRRHRDHGRVVRRPPCRCGRRSSGRPSAGSPGTCRDRRSSR